MSMDTPALVIDDLKAEPPAWREDHELCAVAVE